VTAARDLAAAERVATDIRTSTGNLPRYREDRSVHARNMQGVGLHRVLPPVGHDPLTEHAAPCERAPP
jgi:hypothetical protein